VNNEKGKKRSQKKEAGINYHGGGVIIFLPKKKTKRLK